MRLLYVCSDHGIPADGTKGASIHVRAITRALARIGHTVKVLCPRGRLPTDHPAEHLADGDSRLSTGAFKTLQGWLGPRGLDESLPGEVRGLLYNAQVREQAVPALRSQAPIDAVVERLSLFGLGGLDIAQELDVPLVVEVNALMSREARRFRSLAMAELAETIERRVLLAADAAVAVSAELADQVESLGVSAERLFVVPNGVDVEQFASAPSREECRERLGFSDHFVVGFVGSLKPWHGVEVLIDAFEVLVREERAERARLLIVGDGPQAEHLRERARRLGLEAVVRFTGAVPHEQVPALLRAMDVGAAPFLPMDDFYFSPIKLFEYFAAGASVVASDIGQIGTLLTDNVHGLLCKPGDARSMAAALSRLHQQPQLRERLAEAARRELGARYTWARAAESVAEIVRGVIAARPRGVPERLEAAAS